MSNPLVHAERSAKKWGGKADEYLELHRFFDQTKAHVPDNRHRLILHNSFGILLAERVFGPQILNADGKRVFVRDLGAQHVLEDLRFIPTLAQCLENVPVLPWMAGSNQLMSSSHFTKGSESDE
jgi:hypothetical protein